MDGPKKKVHEQGSYERTQEDYPIHLLCSFCRYSVVFLCSFITALFLYFSLGPSVLEMKFLETFVASVFYIQGPMYPMALV